MNAPFGLSTEWNRDTANTRATATKSEVKAVNYNLTGAYKVTEKISVALGASYVMVDAVLKRMAAIGSTIPADLSGDGHGMAYNVAAMYKFNDKWNFGANYHSKVKSELRGNLLITSVTPVKADLTLPDMLQFGAAYKYSDKWTFAADADYTNWTTYRNIIVIGRADGVVKSKDIKNWESTWAFRLGSEYKYSDTLKLRAGTFYDMNPVSQKHLETRVPDTDRVALAIGAGWNKNNITVDVSYMYLMFMERKITDSMGGDTTVSTTDQRMNGKYNSVAHLPAITIGYKF